MIARSVATLVACLMLLQVALAGFAVAATDAGDGVVFGATCASQKASGENGQPSMPASGHRHGLCCILHSGALGALPVKPNVALTLNFPAEAIAPAPFLSAPAPRVEPQHAPQSPRAPPARAA